MTSDLFGNPLRAQPPFELNRYQKRQATLLYHWMSLDYLKGLLVMIDALINGADVTLALARRQGRDALIANERWGVRDTAANWSTHVFPVLEDFKKATLRDIALRATESFEFTGANQCARMLSEFSSMWMTPDEEQAFQKQFDAVSHYAQFIDFAAGVGGRKHQLDDRSMAAYWDEHADLFPRLPRFRVRRDVQGLSGELPPRTGVYVCQDDPLAALQFAWTGNADGRLGDAQTLNESGKKMVTAIGRDALWHDENRMIAYATSAFKRREFKERGSFPAGAETRQRSVRAVVNLNVRTSRPCAWYYVELIDGEFEDDAAPAVDAAQPATRLRCAAGLPCPREGWWSTPAGAGRRRHFQAGETMPEVNSDYGATIWQWDESQQG